MRARIVAAGVTGVAVAAGGIFAWQAGDEAPRAATAPTGATAAVEQRDLVERLTADGTLGYADARTTAARLPGTLTWLPREGAVVESGGRLFEVDGEPVILLDGTVPAWRELGPSTDDGADVRQLQRALGVTADGEWGWETTQAVEDLQERHGLEETGRLELGRVVFLPGARRVSGVESSVGSPAGGGPVLTTTSTRPTVSVSLSAADQQVAHRGARVNVLLPDGRDVSGRVRRVGTVARSAGGQPGEESDPTVTVRVALTGRGARRLRLDEAPVSVELVRQRRRDVLAVPANALIGVTGGGYAVQTPGGGQIAVEPGLFADGWVEVEGRGLRAGQQVVVPT